MKKIMMFLSSFVAMFGCFSCQSVKHLPTKEFEQLVNNEDVQLVDVRRPDEFAAGHIQGARLINVQSADFISLAESQLDKSKPVAVYCRSGKRSREAAKQLTKKGFKVYNLDKGYLDWAEHHQ